MSSLSRNKNRSQIWLHFTPVDGDNNVYCLYCNRKLSVANKSTYSLIRHINKKHPAQPIVRRPREYKLEPIIAGSNNDSMNDVQTNTEPASKGKKRASTAKITASQDETYEENVQAIRRAICAGCLSQGRKLTPIRDLKKYAFFCFAMTFDEKDWVCWECRRMVVKLAGFRRQVAEAQGSLADLMSGRPCQIRNLSKLSSVTITEPEEGELFEEVEALDPQYYQLVTDTTHIADKSGDNDEAMGDDEAKREDEAVGDDEATGDGAARDDDQAIGEAAVETLVSEDDNDHDKTSIHITYLDERNVPMVYIAEKQVRVNENPKSKPIILKRACSVVKIVSSNTGERVTENPFTIDIMSQDEMIKWRGRKSNMEFYANCSSLLRCEKCLEPFDSKRLYIAHMKGHSKDFGEKPCDICDLKFYDEEQLKAHKERHYKLLKCNHCGFQWDSSNGMRRHCLAAHGVPTDAWQCDQ